MRITFDPSNRERTLRERGLDFTDAAAVLLAETRLDIADTRFAYPEPRIVTFGHLRGRLVVVVWTPDGDDGCRVISMRKANEREQERYARTVG